MENTWKHYHRIQNYLICSDVYNVAQKLDNSVQLFKITGHALRRKVVSGGRVILSKALTRPARVTLPAL